jgi:hypothetical protein
MSKTKEILARAEKMGLTKGLVPEKTDVLSIIMDIEGAVEFFNIDEEKWLSSDDFNFSHDFCGIIENVKRDSYPPKDFGLFVPKFARIKEEHKV